MSIKKLKTPLLTIDRAALMANYRYFAELGQAEAAGVVKADGYGLGLEPVVEALLEAGCQKFFVATPDEGARARACAPEAQIMVLGGLYYGGEDFYLAHHLVPIINSPEELARWRDFSRMQDLALPCWLHIDTGMNRLGFGAAEWQDFCNNPAQAAPLHIMGLMSHFIASEDESTSHNQEQAARFAAATRDFPDLPKSLCNSSGCFLDPGWHYDVLRPGYALYGGNPTPKANNPMRTVVGLEAPVLQSRTAKKEETVGYNATYRFEQDTRIATLALGYADGFLRGGSNRAHLYYQGRPCPVRGRVSMDLITIETGHLATPPGPGDLIEILGPHQSVDQLAHGLGTIGYEILTALGSRFERSWRP